jgi:hypothetical protein
MGISGVHPSTRQCATNPVSVLHARDTNAAFIEDRISPSQLNAV